MDYEFNTHFLTQESTRYGGNSIQSLTIRPHDEIARDLTVINSIDGGRKLSFVRCIFRDFIGSIVKQYYEKYDFLVAIQNECEKQGILSETCLKSV